MKRFVRRVVSDRSRGQGLVEFVVALPLIVVLMLGLFDAGRVVINYSTLTNATRAGARVAIVNQSNDATCTSVRTFKCAAAEHSVGMGISAAAVPNLVVTGSDCAILGGCTITVTMSQPVDLVTPIIGALMGPFNLTASTTMPVERTFANP